MECPTSCHSEVCLRVQLSWLLILVWMLQRRGAASEPRTDAQRTSPCGNQTPGGRSPEVTRGVRLRMKESEA